MEISIKKQMPSPSRPDAPPQLGFEVTGGVAAMKLAGMGDAPPALTAPASASRSEWGQAAHWEQV